VDLDAGTQSPGRSCPRFRSVSISRRGSGVPPLYPPGMDLELTLNCSEDVKFFFERYKAPAAYSLLPSRANHPV
jgi:hypothetical protein